MRKTDDFDSLRTAPEDPLSPRETPQAAPEETLTPRKAPQAASEDPLSSREAPQAAPEDVETTQTGSGSSGKTAGTSRTGKDSSRNSAENLRKQAAGTGKRAEEFLNGAGEYLKKAGAFLKEIVRFLAVMLGAARQKVAESLHKAAVLLKKAGGSVSEQCGALQKRAGASFQKAGRSLQKSGRTQRKKIQTSRKRARSAWTGLRKTKFFRKYPEALPLAFTVLTLLLCVAVFWSVRGVTARQETLENAQTGTVTAREDAASAPGIIPQEGAGLKTPTETAPVQNAVRRIAQRTVKDVTALEGGAREAVLAGFAQILDSGQGSAYSPPPGELTALWEQARNARREELSKDPLLILVNKWHYQPDGYEVESVELSNGQQIGSTCYEPLTQMLADCQEAGGTPIVCSGYRPHWYQENLFEEQISRYTFLGFDRAGAEEAAATAVAVPGTSEHELGLAADIYSSENMELDESQVETFTQQWLMANCWRYGFILRYPQDKSDITGIIFEPWHYRYVGQEHAKKIFDAQICLEEYIDRTDHPDRDVLQDAREAESMPESTPEDIPESMTENTQ